MADPSAVGATGMGASAGGGILGAVGSIFQGQAQAKAFQYQAGVAEINKKIALQNEDYSIRAGEVEANRSGRKTGFMIGEQKAVQASRGLDVNSGSNVGVRDSQHQVGEMDMATIRESAGRRAYGYKVEAANNEAQAQIFKASAKTSKTSSYINAGASILGSASSVSSKWLQGQQVGLWGNSNGGGGDSGYDPWEGIR